MLLFIIFYRKGTGKLWNGAIASLKEVFFASFFSPEKKEGFSSSPSF